jgi:putative alpha-1,2-mannosidase
MFARTARDRAMYDKYIARASNWKNLWMNEAVEPKTGLTGFFQGRYANGTWVTHPGQDCKTCWVGIRGKDGEFYEESAWSYSWFVPHDYAQVIKLVGGKEKFVERLGNHCFLRSLKIDTFFDNGFANVGNEPGLLQAVLYHYAVLRSLKLLLMIGTTSEIRSTNTEIDWPRV